MDVQSFSGTSLIAAMEQTASEKALLTYSDAPDAELRAVQRKLDIIVEELMRRLSW